MKKMIKTTKKRIKEEKINMSVESENAREEIKEIVGKCIHCGMCKPIDSISRVTREESSSPRGKALILREGFIGRFVYDDNLSKACEIQCPIGIKMHEAIILARKIQVLEDKEIPENKEMIKNLQETGNIYGIKEEK